MLFLQVSAENLSAEWDGKKWSKSFNLFLVDHYHYLQSVLYIIRGFIFALQKLSLIMCYLQIAADLHSAIWLNEGLAPHCINIISTLFLSYPKSSDLVTDHVQMFSKSTHLSFQHSHNMLCVKIPIHHLLVFWQTQYEIIHDGQNQTLEQTVRQMLPLLP